jgi:DNA-binding transcriptional regulator YiaG
MVSLAEKITKLETILEQTPPNSPTYQTIKQSLDDLYKERDNQTQSSTDSQQQSLEKDESVDDQDNSVDNDLFQAVGILKGRFKAETVLNEQKQERQLFSFRTQGKNYRLKIKKDTFFAFKIQFQYHPDDLVYVAVYPFLMFIPRKPPELRFELVSWQNTPYDGKEENEFILRGLWQFIPQNRRPLITVMRNWREKEERDDLLKQGDQFKPLHIPILWKDSPVPPYRFNPKAEQQPDRYFVQLKCRFISKMDSFGVKEILSEPTTTFPKYLMSKTKMEKLAALREEKKEKKRQEKEAKKQVKTVMVTMLLEILLEHSFYKLVPFLIQKPIKRVNKNNNQEPIQDNQKELDKDSNSEQEVINKDEPQKVVKTDKHHEEVVKETDEKLESTSEDSSISSLLEKAKVSGLNDTELANLIQSTKKTVIRWRKGQSKPSRHFKDIFQHWKVEDDLWFSKTDSPQFKFK